jgi:cell division protein FtsI (penicillin-binding protein 3)
VSETRCPRARRLGILGVVLLAGFAAVAWRLVRLAVVEGETWAAEAVRQQQRTVRINPERGSFLDREGRPLAVSAVAWSAFADPTAFATGAARREAARALASALDVPEGTIRKKLATPRYFAWLARRLPPETRSRVEALELPGIGFVKESRRLYPQGPLASHVLGTVGIDDVGLDGLEHQLGPDVAGSPGLLLTMRDARGGGFLPAGLSFRPPSRGADVVLTLDTVIQHVAERELRAAVARTSAVAGTVILMYPDGDIAALSNHPSPNLNTQPTHPSHLRTNRAVASCYEPGSTLKMFAVAAALEASLVRPSDTFWCGDGQVVVGRTRIRDHRPFGRLTVAEILEQSSNVGAIRIGQRVGADRLHDTLTRFGFGSRTGLRAPGETPGILRDATAWSPVTLAAVSFGQEVAVSPLQLAAATNALACRGVYSDPRLVREIRRADGTVEALPARAPRRVLSEVAARTLARMLSGVVERGTGRLAQVPGYRIAGKTGTAQKVGPDGRYLDDRHVASFAGWAPADDPAFTLLVVLDEPRGPDHGGDVAAPVFAAVARDVLRYLEIPPQDGAHHLGLDDAT